MLTLFNRRERKEGAKGTKGLNLIKIVTSSLSYDNQQ